MPGPPLQQGPAPLPHLHARIVPARHALAWFEEAMRLFKVAPLPWIGLAAVTVAVELALGALPSAGALLAGTVAPLVACGLVYAAAAADRGRAPSLRFAMSAFFAGTGAVAAIVITSLATFAAEAFAGWWIAGVNLLAPDGEVTGLTPEAMFGIRAFGILASLPFTFVAFHVLLDRARPGAAFAASFSAFAQNTLPLIAYGAASLVLLGFAVLTAGLGLLLVMPLSAAATYAAWKDIFGVRDGPEV